MEACRAGYRISPIFPINNAVPPDFASDRISWILFLGPVHPGILEGTTFHRLFLTLGLFNILIFSDTEETRQEAQNFALSNGLRWEQWQLVGNRVFSVDFSPQQSPALPVPPPIAQPIPGLPEALLPSIREYRALTLACASRASIFTPDVLDDLHRFDSLFRQALQDATIDSVVKLGSLANANAALSRFLSQTYSGASPIHATETYFSTHSLLGIGIASLALVRIRRFVEEVIAQLRMTDRLKSLRNRRPNPTPLQSLSGIDDFWLQDHLSFEHDGDKEPANDPTDIRSLPLLTFFSGRDGFRSTEFSLSAPLEVVSSCNSLPWSIQTITHEISHVIVENIIATVLPRPDDIEAISGIVRLLQPGQLHMTLFEQLTAYVCFGVWQMSTAENVVDEGISPALLSERLNTFWFELQEILTHTLDFLYFYKADPHAYVGALWVSWDVIPNIKSRIPEYLTRCLCALHSNNLRRGKEGQEITVDQLHANLLLAQENFPAAIYIPQAIRELEDRRLYYITRLQKRAVLVKFVRYFLHSPTIEQKIMRGITPKDPEVGSLGFMSGEFSNLRIANPLRFIEEVSKDRQGDGLRSAWILTQLAFRGDT